MKTVRVGQWVTWHSKTKKRYLKGVVVDVRRSTAKIIWTTFDGQGHHWIAPIWKLRDLPELNEASHD